MAQKRQIALVHPGEILLGEFLEPMGVSQYRLAKNIGVPARRINEIVKGLRRITPDTALRLGLFFDMSPEFWVNLQSHYDLDRARETLRDQLERTVVPRNAASA
jgi:addiction module HigA family antidote